MGIEQRGSEALEDGGEDADGELLHQPASIAPEAQQVNAGLEPECPAETLERLAPLTVSDPDEVGVGVDQDPVRDEVVVGSVLGETTEHLL